MTLKEKASASFEFAQDLIKHNLVRAHTDNQSQTNTDGDLLAG